MEYGAGGGVPGVGGYTGVYYPVGIARAQPMVYPCTYGVLDGYLGTVHMGSWTGTWALYIWESGTLYIRESGTLYIRVSEHCTYGSQNTVFRTQMTVFRTQMTVFRTQMTDSMRFLRCT